MGGGESGHPGGHQVSRSYMRDESRRVILPRPPIKPTFRAYDLNLPGSAQPREMIRIRGHDWRACLVGDEGEMPPREGRAFRRLRPGRLIASMTALVAAWENGRH